MSRLGLPHRFTRPMPVVEGVYQLRAPGARVTALLRATSVCLVDAGGRGSLPWIEAGLQALGASLRDVELIVLTHCHPDHAGGLGRLAAASGAGVAVHESEAEYVLGRRSADSPFRSALLRRLSGPFVPLFYTGAVANAFTLADGDVLSWLEEVRIIHTPGHTPGSICLHLPDKKLLISGDAMQCRFGRLRAPARAVTLDPELAMRSLERLARLDFEAVCFSHFSPLRQGGADAVRRLVNDRKEA